MVSETPAAPVSAEDALPPEPHEEAAAPEGVAEAPAARSGATIPPEPPETAEDAEDTPEDTPEPPAENRKRWYVVKVQSGREDSIKEAIERKVKIEGLEEYYGQIIIPVEKETVITKGKRVVRERKLFPGYIMAQVEYNDHILYLFRETSGVGDFVGGGPNHPPQPMKDHEVEKMLKKIDQAGPGDDKVVIGKAPFSIGDHVKVRDGVFSGMDGDVKEINSDKGVVRIELMVIGRPVSVELEYWQVEPM